MIAYIKDNNYLYLDLVSTDIEDTLVREFSVFDPKARYSIAFEDGQWDGRITSYDRKGKKLSIAFLEDLKRLCQKEDIPLDVVDQRPEPKYKPIPKEQLNCNILQGIKLEDHQMRCLNSIYEHDCGIHAHKTGSGKSEMIAGIISMFPKCPTMVIAEEKIVLSQLVERLQLRSITDVGEFYAGKRPDGQLIIVGSIQALSLPPGSARKAEIKRTGTDKAWQTRRKNALYLQEAVKKCHLLLVDECVHEDSYITTDKGLIKAKRVYENINKYKVKVGDKYYDIENKSEKFDNAILIKSKQNHELICSKNHKIAILNRDGSISDEYSSDIQIGQYLLLNNKICDINKSSNEFIKWRGIGLFIGDGHFLNNKQIKFVVRKDAVDWRIACEQICEVFGGNYVECTNNRNDYVFRVRSHGFVTQLKELGFSKGRKTGKMTLDFDIPSRVAAAGLLCGLFDSEGSSYIDRVKFDSSDEVLIKLAQNLCTYLGIKSSISISNHRSNLKHAVLHRLTISGLNCKRFYDLVGFKFARKIKNNIHKSSYSESFDCTEIYNNLRKFGLYPRHLARLFNTEKYIINNAVIDTKTLYSWKFKLNNLNIKNYNDAKNILALSDERIARMLNISVMTVWKNRYKYLEIAVKIQMANIKSVLDRISPLIDNYTISEVSSISKSKSCRLIDFTISGASRFEANGILVHNCDRSSSDSYTDLFTKLAINARYRYGFSGTPFDDAKPVQNLIIREHFGNIISQSSRDELEAIGRIIPVTYTMLACNENGNKHDKTDNNSAIKEWMIENTELHNKINKICQFYKDEGTLILVESLPLGEKLAEVIPGSEFIHGKTSDSRREEVINRFESRELKVLIGSKILRRGLDLKGGCENLILCYDGQMGSEFMQRLGRAVRKNKKGSSRVFDFLIMANHYLYKHARKRLEAVVAEGYKSTVVYKGIKVSGEDIIRRRWRFPKSQVKT